MLAEEVGSVADLGRLLEMTVSQANQFAGPNPSRNIGTSIARRLERACDKPEGWLDIEHPKPITETLRDLQVQEALRILQTLSDVELTRSLAWLQELVASRSQG
ncbi:hypothetical protein KMC49_gp02 [Ralstonia phage Firinga]|uniref:Uncharacterized protein n=2 Tax=Firingavirus TaxID=2843381 RepID=A0A7G5B9U7_9CAUD|nr:hypothetical protein KMC49_gp02 [Ralstonia phage Firinga]QMV33070.1 hypothetical protein 18C_00002 [Ralstonia phage Firinga]